MGKLQFQPLKKFDFILKLQSVDTKCPPSAQGAFKKVRIEGLKTLNFQIIFYKLSWEVNIVLN